MILYSKNNFMHKNVKHDRRKKSVERFNGIFFAIAAFIPCVIFCSTFFLVLQSPSHALSLSLSQTHTLTHTTVSKVFWLLFSC